MTLEGNLAVGIGGGPTSVINKTVGGVFEAGKEHNEIQEIWALMYGIDGIFQKKADDLRAYDSALLERILNQPGAASGSARTKPEGEELDKIVDFFMENNIRYFVYIGGNDSSSTLREIAKKARERNYEMRILHVSKTVDNDLAVGFVAPGYPSAARSGIIRAGDEWHDAAAFQNRVKIEVVMGRYAGWLAEALKLAKEIGSNGPNLVYTPERMLLKERRYQEVALPDVIKNELMPNVRFNLLEFIEDVRKALDEDGYAHIILSESLKDYVRTETGEKLNHRIVDAHGHGTLSADNALGDYLCEVLTNSLKVKPRTEPYGYWLRTNSDYRSQVDLDAAKMLGRAAVEAMIKGESGRSLVLERVPNNEVGENFVRLCNFDNSETGYSLVPMLVDVEDVAKKVRFIPARYVSGPADSITPEFKEYLEGMLIGEDMPVERGLPERMKLGLHLVKGLN